MVNGFEVCTQLRRSSLFADTPVVILTGNDGAFDQVKSKLCGATEFISKPISQEKIVRVLDKHL
jgi:chemotaxis family two-component system response regulator PixG